jgi:hypothetical protein
VGLGVCPRAQTFRNLREWRHEIAHGAPVAKTTAQSVVPDNGRFYGKKPSSVAKIVMLQGLGKGRCMLAEWFLYPGIEEA